MVCIAFNFIIIPDDFQFLRERQTGEKKKPERRQYALCRKDGHIDPAP